MKKVSRQELKEILEEHRLWLNGTGGNRADLRDAYLQRADLQGADLRGADLQRADLQGADLRDADLAAYQIPQHGELRVYKKVDGRIVHLLIPRNAKRTASMVGRKCRAEFAKVLAVQGDAPVVARPFNGKPLEYRIGEIVRPDSYDSDPRVECTHGIHFFLTREEAEAFR